MAFAGLKDALAGIKAKQDKHSTEALGMIGSTSKNAKLISSEQSALSSLNFYTGDIIDKSKTGFTGLLNQGATCYLNSLIQSLFMTPELRKAVFEWKYDKKVESKRCIPYQLQRLFAEMQITIKGALSTTNLTTSFGWKGREVYQQHDVLELADVLFTQIENQANGTQLCNVVTDLHRGQTIDYIQCLKCKTFKGRPIPVSGLGLNIENVTDFDSAMKTYITPEILSGDNKYRCSVCGDKQDAKKGIKLVMLPYFLSIFMKRWTFDFRTFRRIKIQKGISFPMKFDGSIYINSDGYLQNDNENNDTNDNNTVPPMIYELYSIMVHTGGATGGHYFAYIKDFESGKWLQFNDSRVTEISEDQINEWFYPKPKMGNDYKPSLSTGVFGSFIYSNNNDNNVDDEKKDDNNAVKKKKKKKNKVTFLNPMSGGYNLMYRLVDPNRNINIVDKSLIPEDIVNDINKTDEVYKKKKAKYDEMRQFIKLLVHYKPPSKKEYEYKAVLVKRKENLQKAHEKVYKELALDVGIHNTRLRNFQPYNETPMEPYDDDLDETPEEMEFVDPKNVMLEIKKEGDKFVEYEMGKITLKMVELNEETNEFKDEILIQAKDNCLVEVLRGIVAKQKNVDNPGKVRIIYFDALNKMAFRLDQDKEKIKKNYNILNGYKIYIEICEDYKDGSNSKLLKKIDGIINNISMYYNKIFEVTAANADDEIKFDQNLQIDQRKTIKDLRETLAQKLNVDGGKLVLRKGFNGQQLKDINQTLRSAGISETEMVYCEIGTILQPDEFLFQIFIEDEIYKKKKQQREEERWLKAVDADKKDDGKEVDKSNGNATENNGNKKGLLGLLPPAMTVKAQLDNVDLDLGDPFLCVGELVLNQNWKMSKVKQEIKTKIENIPELFRIRGFNNNRLTDCYFDKGIKKVKKKKKTVPKKTGGILGGTSAAEQQALLDSIIKKKTQPKTVTAKPKPTETAKPTEARKPTATANESSEGQSKTTATKPVKKTNERKEEAFSLKDNLGKKIQDYTQICCQQITQTEELTKSHLLLYVARWYPQKMIISPFNEMSFKKFTKIKTELREILAKMSGIPYEHLRVCNPLPWYLKPKERKNLATSDWEGIKKKLNDKSTIAGKNGWKCKMGQFILYKDNREQEQYFDDSININMVSHVNDNAVLKIYSPDEQIAMEREAELKNKKAIDAQEQAKLDAIERLNKSKGDFADKVKKSVKKSQNDNDNTNENSDNNANNNENTNGNTNDTGNTNNNTDNTNANEQ